MQPIQETPPLHLLQLLVEDEAAVPEQVMEHLEDQVAEPALTMVMQPQGVVLVLLVKVIVVDTVLREVEMLLLVAEVGLEELELADTLMVQT